MKKAFVFLMLLITLLMVTSCSVSVGGSSGGYSLTGRWIYIVGQIQINLQLTHTGNVVHATITDYLPGGSFSEDFVLEGNQFGEYIQVYGEYSEDYITYYVTGTVQSESLITGTISSGPESESFTIRKQ